MDLDHNINIYIYIFILGQVFEICLKSSVIIKKSFFIKKYQKILIRITYFNDFQLKIRAIISRSQEGEHREGAKSSEAQFLTMTQIFEHDN